MSSNKSKKRKKRSGEGKDSQRSTLLKSSPNTSFEKKRLNVTFDVNHVVSAIESCVEVSTTEEKAELHQAAQNSFYYLHESLLKIASGIEKGFAHIGESPIYTGLYGIQFSGDSADDLAIWSNDGNLYYFRDKEQPDATVIPQTVIPLPKDLKFFLDRLMDERAKIRIVHPG